jgi:hypothetical protein
MDEVKSITSEDEGKTFTVPESRIGSAADARSLVGGFKRAEIERSRRRARINGNLNGNRPWPSLVGQGQGDRANFNQREGEGFVAAAKTPYYDLVFEVDRYAQFTLDYGDDPTRIKEWEEKIGTRYHYALDNWDGMDTGFQRSQYQMIVHGVGPMTWEDARDWRSKSCMAGQFLLPDDASADIEEWDTAAQPRSYLPSDLYDKIKNESVATAAKWNVPAVKQAIMQAAPKTVQDTYGTNWEFYEAEIRKGSANWNNNSKRIFVADLFQKEFTGKVSHFIILDKAGVDSDEPSKEPEAGFLFRKIGRFDCFTEILQPFLYDVGGDGQWHSVKGAGPKILDFCSISDRLTCKMIDGANASSGLIVQANDANALQKTAIAHINGGVCLSPGYTIHQNRFSDNLQSPLLVKRDLKQTLDRNTGQYRQRANNEIPYPTLGQEQMNASEEAMLSKGDVNRYYRSLDKWHRETFKRMLAMGKKLFASRKDMAPDEADANLTPSEEGALEFYRGCVEDGVPEDALDFENFCRIKATRTVGNGSAQMRLMIADKLMQALPTMDERGRNATERMWASALGGQTVADMIYPRLDAPQLNDDHMALATLENNALRVLGGQVLITPRQDHVIHFQIHLQDVAAHAQTLQQGQSDPMQLLIHLEQAGPHTYEHLSAIQNDPTRKAQVEQMTKSWIEMSRSADQLKQHIEESQKAQEANQPPQQPDPALIAALAKVHGDLQIKQTKMQGDLALKKQKQDATLHLKDLQTAHNLKLKTFETAASQSMAA